MTWFKTALVSCLVVCSSSLNILVYSPVFGGSHMADVTRRNEIGVKITKNVIIVDKENAEENAEVDMDEVLKPLWLIQNRPKDFETCFKFFIDMMIDNCKEFTANKKVFEMLSSVKLDVAIAEPVSVCGLGYFSALGITKTIIASSTTHYEGVVRHTGEPVDMSYVPVHGAYFDEKMSILERYTNWASGSILAGNLEVMFDLEMEAYRKNLGAQTGNWKDLIPSASVMFTNSNPYLDFPRPIIQKTVGIGGISVDLDSIRKEKLGKEWGPVLDERKHNMLISFGSMVKSSTMPEEWRSSILSVIKSLPEVTFIWKYESKNLTWASGVSNVHFYTWIPQTRLLNDKRITAFLTHGGLGSTNELAHIGKPAIVVPIFGDQGRNAPMLARHGGALVLDKFELENEEKLGQMVRAVLFDESYSKNASHLANLLNSAPFTPKELVIKHTEFVAQFGPLTQMDPYIRQLNWFQKSFLDIYILMVATYSLIIFLPIYLCCRNK